MLAVGGVAPGADDIAAAEVDCPDLRDESMQLRFEADHSNVRRDRDLEDRAGDDGSVRGVIDGSAGEVVPLQPGAVAEAVHGGDEGAMSEARKVVREALGDAAFVDACATIASFNAVVKIADGAGIPLEDYKEEATRDIREELAINNFQT